MNIHAKTNAVAKKMEQLLSESISRRADTLLFGISEKATEVFVNNLKVRIDERATPKDGYSRSLLEEVKNNITAETERTETANYTNKIYIKPDREGLVSFLEFGTGLVGYQNPHKQAHKYGWEYAINASNYRYRRYRPDGIVRPNAGWFFRYGDSYLDVNDEYPINKTDKFVPEKQWVRTKSPRYKVFGYSRRFRGKQSEKVPQDKNSAFSEGLKPLRFFYDTKNEFNRIFRKLSRSQMNNAEDEERFINIIEEKRL